jgi:hypothetical protein
VIYPGGTPVTRGIEKTLRWLETWKGQIVVLRSKTDPELSQYLYVTAFRTGVQK